jgi:hypothetical protein
MNMQRIPVVDVIAGDWIMIPPGNGRHRGESNDSGILVVEDVWEGCREALVFGHDMIDGWQYTFSVDGIEGGHYHTVAVVR